MPKTSWMISPKPRLKKRPAGLAEAAFPSFGVVWRRKIIGRDTINASNAQRHSSAEMNCLDTRGTVESGGLSTMHPLLHAFALSDVHRRRFLYKILASSLVKKTFHGPEEYLRNARCEGEVLAKRRMHSIECGFHRHESGTLGRGYRSLRSGRLSRALSCFRE